MRLFPLLLLVPLLSFSQSNFEQAQLYFDQKQYEKAKPLYEIELRIRPDNLKALEGLGDIFSFQNNWADAAVLYQKLCVNSPKIANYHYKFGGAKGMEASQSSKLQALKMVGEVEDEFKTAIKLNPKHLGARWALIELYLQLPRLFGGGEVKAAAYAKELQQLSEVDGFLARGHIAEYYTRYAAAESYYKKAIVIGQSETTYKKLADLYRNKMKQPEKAKAVWENYQKTKG